jgi:hypothetical protein
MRYIFGDIFGEKLPSLSAQEIGECLETIRRDDERGLLFIDAVVEAAQQSSGRSSLFKAFEWDTKKAAEKYRRVQARQLISSLYVNLPNMKGPVRAYVAIRGKGYRSITEVMSDSGLRTEFLTEALKKLQGVRHQYEGLSELGKVYVEIEKVRKHHETKRHKAIRSSKSARTVKVA